MTAPHPLPRRRFLQLLGGLGFAWALPARARADERCVLDTLWNRYKARYIQADGRVIDYRMDARSTSEGQTYALFHALVYDDRECFGRVLAWLEEHLAGGDLARGRVGWHWGRGEDGEWRMLDANNAVDADLMLVYALAQAARLWRQTNYLPLAENIAATLMKENIATLPELGRKLLPGREGFVVREGWRLNPSYALLPLLRQCAALWPRQGWESALAAEERFLEHCAGRAGHAPEWALWRNEGRCDDDPVHGAIGSYDAIRVYFWLAHKAAGRRLLARRYRGMAAWLREHPYPPERVNVHTGDGEGIATPGFSAALLPYLHALDEEALYFRERGRVLHAIGDDPQLRTLSYYDVNLILFGLGAVQRRYAFGRNGELVRGRPC